MNPKSKFKPAEIMGYFWLVLGLAVFVGTFFIKAGDQVVRTHDVVTNIIGSTLLILIGLISIISGRVIKKRDQAK